MLFTRMGAGAGVGAEMRAGVGATREGSWNV